MSLYWALALTLTISITTFRTIDSFPSRHNRQCPQFNPFCTNVAFENGCYICNPVSNIGTSSSLNSNSGTNRSPTGELLCNPYPSMCLPMYIQLDDNDCPVCTMNGGAQNPFHQAASNINNCPPIQWNCPMLHIDRNGCPLCGSKAPTTHTPLVTIPTALKQSSTNRQNKPPPNKSPTYQTQTSIKPTTGPPTIITQPTQSQASKQQLTQQVPTKSNTSRQSVLSTTKTSKPVKVTSIYVSSTVTSAATKSSFILNNMPTNAPMQLVTMPTTASTQLKVTRTNQPSGTNSNPITTSTFPTLITSTSTKSLTRSNTTPKTATPILSTKSKPAPTAAFLPIDSSATKTMSTSAIPPIPTATPRPIQSTQQSTTLKTKPLLSSFPHVTPTNSSTSITRTTFQSTNSIQALTTPKSLRPGAPITKRNNTSIYTRSLASMLFTVQTQTLIDITNKTTALTVKTSALPTRRSSKATTTVFNCLPFPADCPQLPGCFSFDSNACMVCTCSRTTTPVSTTCATLQCLLDCQGKPLKKDARGCDLCLCET